MPRDNNTRRSAAAARDRAEEMIEDKSDQAREMWDEAKDRAGEAWDTTKKRVGRKAAQVQDYAEHNPWQIAAISAGVGLLLGALLMRRRND